MFQRWIKRVLCNLIQQLKGAGEAGEGDVAGFGDDVAVRVDVEGEAGVNGDIGGERVVRAPDGEVGSFFGLREGGEELRHRNVADHAQVKAAVLRVGVGCEHEAAALIALQHHGGEHRAVHVVGFDAVVHCNGAGGLFLREEDL